MWFGCSRAEAVRLLEDRRDGPAQDAESRRVAAVVDAAADGRADPDWDGW